MSDVYYCPYLSRHIDKITIVCLQWFDEYDYDQTRFLKDEEGCRYQFDTEEEAVYWLNKYVKPDKIDPEYKRVNPQDYLL